MPGWRRLLANPQRPRHAAHAALEPVRAAVGDGHPRRHGLALGWADRRGGAAGAGGVAWPASRCTATCAGAILLAVVLWSAARHCGLEAPSWLSPAARGGPGQGFICAGCKRMARALRCSRASCMPLIGPQWRGQDDADPSGLRRCPAGCRADHLQRQGATLRYDDARVRATGGPLPDHQYLCRFSVPGTQPVPAMRARATWRFWRAAIEQWCRALEAGP